MFVVFFIDPTGREAGKSYSADRELAQQTGRGWVNVYPGNTFRVEKETAAKGKRHAA